MVTGLLTGHRLGLPGLVDVISRSVIFLSVMSHVETGANHAVSHSSRWRPVC